MSVPHGITKYFAIQRARAYHGLMSEERKQEIHSFCSYAALFLSVVALFTVLTGYLQPPQADEGVGAHIFQLSNAALAPTILVFLATVDWKRPLRGARPLAFAAAALVLAFGALYYLEHYRDPDYAGGAKGGQARSFASTAKFARSPLFADYGESTCSPRFAER